MGFSIASESIENLKSQIDILDVVGQVVDMKRTGANYKGLCPFHQEKTPSFYVSESRQYFTCFGCGASGDVISFVEKYYNKPEDDGVGDYLINAVESTINEFGDSLEMNEKVSAMIKILEQMLK